MGFDSFASCFLIEKGTSWVVNCVLFKAYPVRACETSVGLRDEITCFLEHGRDGPKLLHQAQIVAVGPGFHELAVCKAKDVDRGLADVFAGRRKTEKAPLVSATM